MYGFTTCYLATRINTKTSGNGLLSLYLTIATVKDNEKEDWKTLLEKEKMLSILAQTTQYTLHIVFGQQMHSTLTNLEFYSMEKSLCKTVVIT